MRFQTVKTPADLPAELKDQVKLVFTDKTLTALIIGGVLQVKVESYNLKVVKTVPFDTAARFRLAWTHDAMGAGVEHLENDWDATARKEVLEKAGATVTVESVMARLDDDGNVVGDSARPFPGVPVVNAEGPAPFPF